MRRNRAVGLLLLCAVGVPFVGCSHAAPVKDNAVRDLTVENRLLQERVRRLEQKVSDLDAQLSVLAHKRPQRGAAKAQRVMAPSVKPIRTSINIDVVLNIEG